MKECTKKVNIKVFTEWFSWRSELKYFTGVRNKGLYSVQRTEMKENACYASQVRTQTWTILAVQRTKTKKEKELGVQIFSETTSLVWVKIIIFVFQHAFCKLMI